LKKETRPKSITDIHRHQWPYIIFVIVMFLKKMESNFEMLFQVSYGCFEAIFFFSGDRVAHGICFKQNKYVIEKLIVRNSPSPKKQENMT